jgi:hypothetical protein
MFERSRGSGPASCATAYIAPNSAAALRNRLALFRGFVTAFSKSLWTGSFHARASDLGRTSSRSSLQTLTDRADRERPSRSLFEDNACLLLRADPRPILDPVSASTVTRRREPGERACCTAVSHAFGCGSTRRPGLGPGRSCGTGRPLSPPIRVVSTTARADIARMDHRPRMVAQPRPRRTLPTASRDVAARLSDWGFAARSRAQWRRISIRKLLAKLSLIPSLRCARAPSSHLAAPSRSGAASGTRRTPSHSEPLNAIGLRTTFYRRQTFTRAM